MLNPGDHDIKLDDMSRKAAGRYIVLVKADWPKVEAELDKVLPVEKKKKFSPFWWVLPVLLVGSAVYWLVMDNKKGNANTISTNKITTATISPSQSAEKEQTATAKAVKNDELHQPANTDARIVSPQAKIASDKSSPGLKNACQKI